MSHDGLPARATTGARAAVADRHPANATPGQRGIFAVLGVGFAIVLAACGTSGSSGGVAGATGTPLTSTAPETSASVSTEPSASASTRAQVVFQEANASKVFGGGVISDLGDGSSAVTLGVVAVNFTDPMPAEIVAGACADIVSAPAPSVSASAGAGGSAEPSVEASAAASAAASTAPEASAGASSSAEASLGPSVAPTPATLPVKLNDVTGGSSNTVVQMSLSDLLASPSAIVLHKSAADPTVTACADVTSNPIPVASSAPSVGASTEPSTEASLPAASGSTAP